MAAADKEQQRRESILAAATVLFCRYGLRRTSVDLLAQEAGVAKPTLYAYFSDKEAIFVAAVEQVARDILATAGIAAAEAESVELRLTQMLAAKFTRLFELVESSPHARELVESSNEHARECIAKADKEFRALLVRVVREAEAAGEIALDRVDVSATGFADALLRAGHGASWHASSAAEHRRHLATLVRLLVAAVTNVHSQ